MEEVGKILLKKMSETYHVTLRRFSTPEKFNVNKKEIICTAIN
jgi:hypothetical protein